MSLMNQKTKVLAACTGVILTGLSLSAGAESLLDVYQQALANDPQFKQAQADWLAAQENLPIARAALLPNLGLQGLGSFNYQDFTTNTAFATNGGYPQTQLQLNLTQPIFNWGAWKSLQRADASVKGATANYYYAQQDLITRTVKAYLNVLQANDVLYATRGKKRAFAEEYDTAKQKFDVGLAPITDVYDSLAKYDQAKAQEIQNINQLSDALESLHAITGHYYTYLNGLTEQGIPLINPAPNNINAWSEIAARQNYQLQSQRYSAESAKANIGEKAAGYLPSFAIQGQVNDIRQWDRTLTFGDTAGQTENLVADIYSIGIGVNWSLLSGGSTVAETRQARYQYASACAKEQNIYSQVVSSTRQAFLGVNSYGSQVRADALSIKSAQSALNSARAGYQVGTRTLLDVLDDTTQLYQNQQSYALDQYSYMNNFVALKESAGTLCGADVAKLSSWITKPLNLDQARQISQDGNTKQPRQPSASPEAESAPETAK